MSIGYYVVCHDKDSYEYFKRLNPATYDKFMVILVGDHKEVPSGMHGKTIVAKLLKNNIENKKTLLTYTAWYALVFNDLIKDDFVGIFEYDCRISNELFKLSHTLKDNCIYGFRKRELPDMLFLDFIPEFVGLVASYVMDKVKGRDFWCPTSNVIMSRIFCVSFVMWYKKFMNKIINIPNHPHIHERAINLYAFWKDYNVVFIPQTVRHYQKCSHNIVLRDKNIQNNLDCIT